MDFSLKLTNSVVDGHVFELDGEGPVRGKWSGCLRQNLRIRLAARAWLLGEYPGGSHSAAIRTIEGELARLMTLVLRLLRRIWVLDGVDVGVDEGMPAKESRLLTIPLLLDDDDMGGRMGEGFCWDGDQQGDMGE